MFSLSFHLFFQPLPCAGKAHFCGGQPDPQHRGYFFDGVALQIVQEDEVANVVAARSGLVTKMETLDGEAQVSVGSTVTKGQLLISGVEDMETFGARTAAGRGTVTARTWYALTTSVPLSGTERQYTEKETTRAAVVIGTRRIKFFANSSIEDTKYDKITKRHACTLFGVPLPVTWVTENLRFYEPVPVERDPVAAEQAAEEALTGYLHALVEPYGEVKSTLCTSRQKSDVLEVTLTAECVEEIGETVPILTEELGKPLELTGVK
jgi:similar to stage IV sporulation protein